MTSSKSACAWSRSPPLLLAKGETNWRKFNVLTRVGLFYKLSAFSCASLAPTTRSEPVVDLSLSGGPKAKLLASAAEARADLLEIQSFPASCCWWKQKFDLVVSRAGTKASNLLRYHSFASSPASQLVRPLTSAPTATR